MSRGCTFPTELHIACAPSEDSDQSAHPRSLIRVFAEYSQDNSKVARDQNHLQVESED